MLIRGRSIRRPPRAPARARAPPCAGDRSRLARPCRGRRRCPSTPPRCVSSTAAVAVSRRSRSAQVSAPARCVFGRSAASSYGAVAGDHVDLAQRAQRRVRHRLQQPIGGAGAAPLDHLAHALDGEQHQRQRLVVADRALELLADALAQERAVAQAGRRVGVGAGLATRRAAARSSSTMLARAQKPATRATTSRTSNGRATDVVGDGERRRARHRVARRAR